jgi:hypothetical protein
VRRDRIDKNGKVTLRHRTRLHHIGVGHAHKGKRVTLLVDGLDVRVISQDGELLRHLTLDPSRDYRKWGTLGPQLAGKSGNQRDGIAQLPNDPGQAHLRLTTHG